MTPSDKLGVHPFHWLVCWQIECPCLQPCVTRAGATCVWLDQQVAGTLASVILKPLFIHNSSLGVQQKPSFPPQRERTGDRQHPWLFSNSRNPDYTPLHTRHVLFWNYWPKCKSRVLILCKRGSWKCEVISNFSAPNPPSLVYCVCVSFAWIHVFVCLPCHHWPELGATGVWNNKHKRDFTPLQSWKDIFFVRKTESISIPDKLCLLPTTPRLPISQPYN